MAHILDFEQFLEPQSRSLADWKPASELMKTARKSDEFWPDIACSEPMPASAANSFDRVLREIALVSAVIGGLVLAVSFLIPGSF
jgi:hypothetical protein